MLHAATYGIDFFVVHLSPSDCEFRMREAAIITDRVRKVSNNQFVILGDFNALSPMDADLNLEKTYLLERYQANDFKNNKHKNLRDDEFDYSVIATFLALPAIDPSHRLVEAEERYTFPAPVLLGQYYEDETHINKSRQRIDFILVSPELAKKCVAAYIFHDNLTAGLSDHFPVQILMKAINLSSH